VSIPDKTEWLLLVAQLPATPSSARVALWRRLRAAGAAGLTNGAWALPHGEEHAALFAELAVTVRANGGSASVFAARSADAAEHAATVARFEADRAREYDEFGQRAAAFLAEVERETRLDKFTFAELEELEDDLQRLTVWLEKIRRREFFPGRDALDGAALLERCRSALGTFARTVYAREGVTME